MLNEYLYEKAQQNTVRRGNLVILLKDDCWENLLYI